MGNMRTRLLALHVLEAVLPACEANMEDDQLTQVGGAAEPHFLKLRVLQFCLFATFCFCRCSFVFLFILFLPLSLSLFCLCLFFCFSFSVVFSSVSDRFSVCPSLSVLQVVDRLFSLLSDCMWEAPVAQAKHSILIKEKVQELKLQVRALSRQP